MSSPLSSFIFVIIQYSFVALAIEFVHNCSVELGYPQVTVITKSDTNLYKEYENVSDIVDIKDSIPMLILQCEASYPIEWTFLDSFPVTTDNLRNWHVNQSRKVVTLWQKESFIFVSNLSLTYRAPAEPRQQQCRNLLGLTEFKDGPIEPESRATKVHSKVHGRYLHINISTSSGHRPEDELPTRYGNDQNCSYIIEFNNSTNMICCDTKMNEYRFFFRGCSDPANCRGFYKDTKCIREMTQNRNFNESERDSIKNHQRPDNCIDGSELAAYGNSGVVVCGSSSVDSQSVTLHYFTSVKDLCQDEAETSTKIPQLYIDQNTEGLPDQMNQILKLCKPKQSNIYVGEQIEFKCIGTYYSFSAGFRWVIRRRDHVSGDVTEELISSEPNSERFQFTENTPEKHLIKSTRISQTRISINDSSIFEIVCVAPIWGSYDWANQTQPLHIVEPTPITFTNGDDQVQSIKFDEDRTIICEASGDPMPILSWHGLPDNVNLLSNYEIGSIAFKFDLDLKEYRNEYNGISCKAVQEPINLNRVKHFILTREPEKVLPFVTIIVPLAVIVFVAIFALYGGLSLKKLHLKTRNLTEIEIKDFFEGEPTPTGGQNGEEVEVNAWKHKYNLKFEIPRKDIEMGELIPGGEFSKVFIGKLKKLETKNQTVVIKTCKPFSDIMDLKALLYELKLRIFIGEHENIVKLLHANTSKLHKREVYLVYEYCQNRDLKRYLCKNREQIMINICAAQLWRHNHMRQNVTYVTLENMLLANLDLLKWVVQILDALIFLGTKKVIHGDIAGRNILLDSNLNAKVCDFGLSHQLTREYYAYFVDENIKKPWKWSALECLQKCKYSIKSDVYSFGITCWEIFSLGEDPWSQYENEQLIEVLESGEVMAMPNFATVDIYERLKECWKLEPSARPSFEEFHEYFSNLIEQSVATNSSCGEE